MVAVGSLARVWVDLPDTLADLATLVEEFERYFGFPWREVMFGGTGPLVHAGLWNAFFAVSRLRPPDEPQTLDELLRETGPVKYNILVG
ncbi:MAG: hypothetical protein QME76_04540 [Bacillota bacterium]|nr:hypothetical protein [Bacillota bacterium]